LSLAKKFQSELGVIKLGVIYIGDREVGKTHLAMELANPQNEYVKNGPE
jgi:hypothetical protein